MSPRIFAVKVVVERLIAIIPIIAIGLFVVYAAMCVVQYFTSREDFKGTRLLIAGLAVLVLVVGSAAYSLHIAAMHEAACIDNYAYHLLAKENTGIRNWNDKEEWDAKREEFSQYYLNVMCSAGSYDKDMEIFRQFCFELTELDWDAECREEIVEGFINERMIGWSSFGITINKPAYREFIEIMKAEREGDV